MDTLQLAFMGFIAVTSLVMVIVMVSFMAMVTKMMATPKLNPQPEPPEPIRAFTPDLPTTTISQQTDIPPADTGLELEDFIPDLTKPVTVVVKEDEHGRVTDGN